MWCLKRPMARKPLMHNYIYFETLEVGSGLGMISPGSSFGLKPRSRVSGAMGAAQLKPKWEGF